MNLETAPEEIAQILQSCNEWLLIRASGKTFALQKNEIEILDERGKILFSFLDETGFQTWRIVVFEKKGNEISFDLTRNFEKEREKIRLVPRVSADELSASVEIARLEKANQIASLIISENKSAKLVRVALNKETGRFAQIVFENSNKKQIAALADVSDMLTPENLLTSAILWLAKLERRKKNPIFEVWILTEKKRTKNLQKLHALLREGWKGKITIFEISRKATKNRREASLVEIPKVEIKHLWRGKTKKLKLTENRQTSRAATEIIKLAPDEIDLLFTKQGETLRFFGLPFARVRKISGAEKVWFGIESKRQILSGSNIFELEDLIENLKIYRRFDSTNKQHALFHLAPEAWLEAILRQNIKLLDANLILSPVYNQFRAENDSIDLLALRKDGRLIVIEIKVSPDREMIFQAADYWRKIELQRRAGNLRKAKIFGDLEIADAPAICYLVAPTLSFHRDFDFLVKTIAEEIEIYRFDINENWREKLKVLRRNLTGWTG